MNQKPHVVRAEPNAPVPARLRLIALIVLMAVAGIGLWSIAGPPRLPASLPAPGEVLSVLSGSVLPLDGLATLLVDVTWLMWLWVVGSLALEVVVVAAEGAAQGAAWVRALRQTADRLTLPLARRAVTAAFAVHVLSRGVAVAAADPLPRAEPALVASVEPSGVVDAPASAPNGAASAGTYVVKAGDTLWSIADSAYGSGTEYRRLLGANVGRRMADGQLFKPEGVIQPGWVLDVPDASWRVEEVDGQRWYTVQAGDTLLGIAARALRDESRWRELFELNRGEARLGAARTLSNPNLIWPGLRLRLPPTEPVAAEPTAVELPIDEVSEPALSVAAAPPPTPTPVPTQSPLAALPPVHALPPLTREFHPLPPFALDQAETAEPAPAEMPEPPSHSPVPSSIPVQALGVVGLAAAAGVATLGVRRLRRWRPLSRAPESEVVVEGGYAEARLAHEFARRLHGGAFDPVTALVGQLQLLVEEYAIGSVHLIAACDGRSSTTLTLAAGLAEQPLLVDLAPILGDRLGAECEAWISADQDVVLRVTRVRRTRLLPAAGSPRVASPCLLPLGVLYDKQVYSAAWPALGHVLVASLPGRGAETILTSVLATLTARRSPEDVRLWLIGHQRALPGPIADLPHVVASIDASDETSVEAALQRLERELDGLTPQSTTELVVVLPELTALGERAAHLERLVGRAPAARFRVIAGTTDPAATASSALLPHFTTRMVLRMDEEEASVALLGIADAAFLDRGGRLLMRLDGREPVELYGYQVATEHLERLVRLMRSAYAGDPTPDGPPSQPRPSGVGSQAAEPARPSARDLEADPTPPATASDDAGATEPSPTVAEVDSPTLQVICFGGPRVLYAGRQVWPGTRGDAKPWEFLLYLACQPREGVRREDVSAAMWPDEEDVRTAMHRFRQLRYRLRESLKAVGGESASEGICVERSGVLYLDQQSVHSDVHEFLELIRLARVFPGPRAIARLERARALFVGDLLASRDARRYAWVDERGADGVTLKEHFRRLFQQATAALAELYVEAEQLDAAADVYEELTELDPCDERFWRALFRLCARCGDRRGLVRHERRLRETLLQLAADEADDEEGPRIVLATEPSPETQEEFQRLLGELDMRERTPTAV